MKGIASGTGLDQGEFDGKEIIKEEVVEANPIKQSFKDKIIISCDNKYKAIFDILVLIFVGYSCITTMYLVAFNPETAHDWTVYFDDFVEATFICDLFLNFIQSYINTETLEEHRNLKDIARNYVWHGWFFVDFVSVFPFNLFFKNA